MHLCTPLGIWGSVGLRACSWLPIGYVLIPTKTSLFWNQFLGSVSLHVIFHVNLVSLVKISSYLVLVL